MPSPQFSISLYRKEGNDYIFWHRIPDTSIRQYRDQSIEIKKILENEYYYNVIGQEANWSEYARNPDLPLGNNYGYVYDFEHDYAPYASMLTTGNYTLVLTSSGGGSGDPQLSRTDKIKSFLIPTAHAQGFPGEPSEIFTIPFTINGGDVIVLPDPGVDPLILQYAPILYFHPSEDYYPMDVESFVEGSALWSQDGTDVQLYSSSSLTFETFEDLIDSGADTSDYYLAFSDPDDDKSIDVDNAHVVYDKIRKKDIYATTTYYRRMNDGGYTVLQYWYFYAMNNWGEEVGGLANNHEGDWESIFVFLNDDEEPEYVAHSSHLNDGENEVLNPFQYNSVRRDWNSDEVVKDNGQIVSFVSLGSHANYHNNNGGDHSAKLGIDKTSTEGIHLNIDNFSDLDSDPALWSQYKGKWGTDQVDVLNGNSGPLGPRYSEVSGHNRFTNPVQWAGIDKIIKTTLDDEALEILFPEQKVSIVFGIAIPEGTTFKVSPHDEVVTFGIVSGDPEILPHFWDIETSMEESTPNTQLTLPYNIEEIQALGYTEEDIVGAYYDPLLNTWSYFPATYDSTTQTATFGVGHFSRYALALQHMEEETATSTEPVSEKIASSYGTRVVRDKPTPEVLGVATSVTSIKELEKLVSSIEQLVSSYSLMNISQREIFQTILEDIDTILKSLRE